MMTENEKETILEVKEDKVRVLWLDTAKALCIILVIVGHALIGLHDASLVYDGSPLWDVYYYIYSFHMPAFFVFAGLFATRGANKKSKDFFLNLLTKIVYPYYLWRLLQSLTIISLGDEVNHPGTWDPYLFVSIFWKGGSQFWFLKALFFMHILYFLFKKYFSDKWFFLFMIALRGAAEFPDMPAVMIPVATMGIFYAAGIALRDELLSLPEQCKAPFLWAIVFGAAWFFFATASLYKDDPVVASAGLPGSLLPAAFSGVLMVVALSGIGLFNRQRWLAYIGKHTMSIYLVHVFFVAGSRLFFVKTLHITDVWLLFPATVFAGLLGSVLFYEAAKFLHIERKIGLA